MERTKNIRTEEGQAACTWDNRLSGQVTLVHPCVR